jgi:hypothetical protein
MLSGLVSAFQAAELATGEDAATTVTSGEAAGPGTGRLPLEQLHEVLEAAFVVPRVLPGE